MPDRLKTIVTIFEDDGTIKRDYKTVHFDGEGAPREVEITTEERQALYGVAHAAGTARISEAEAARDEALAALEQAQS